VRAGDEATVFSKFDVDDRAARFDRLFTIKRLLGDNNRHAITGTGSV
jgi:hypothetical protein